MESYFEQSINGPVNGGMKTVTEELLESINKRLGLLIKATLADELEGKTRADQVAMLESMDFRDEDIIEVLGISKNHLGTIRSSSDD